MAEKRKRIRKYTWYIEPLDQATNNAIVEYLKNTVALYTNYLEGVKTGLIFWEVAFPVITLMQNSKKSFPYKFKVYVKEGGGKCREWKFLKSPKKKKLGRKFTAYPKPVSQPLA